ncbi:hypothetical protein Ancab_007187 [Ancistrocladus abbreviatus]
MLQIQFQQLLRRLSPPSLASTTRRCSSRGASWRCSLITVSHSSSPRRLRSLCARFISSSKMASEHYTFGPYKIDQKEVFYSTDLSYAMVNLRPLLPGLLIQSHAHNNRKKSTTCGFGLNRGKKGIHKQ